MINKKIKNTEEFYANNPKDIFCTKCGQKHSVNTSWVLCTCGEVIIYEQNN